MRFSDLRGSTSLRLGALFMAVFGSTSLIFVGVIYFTTSRYLSGNPDERMRLQALALERMAPERVHYLLNQRIKIDPTGRRPFGLFTADGRPIAGNLVALPRERPRLDTFFETNVRTDREHTIYRSFIHALPDGKLIVISRNIEELQRFRDELMGATLLGLALMMVLGAVGSVVVGAVSLRRVDLLTRAVERITRGDLSQRLPERGSNDETDRLVRVVNDMLDQIERLMGEVKGVCDSIAHDLRTPLTRLLAGLERANRRNLPAAERSAEIADAIAEVQQMLRTFAALLRISEIEDGARRASFRAVDLAQVANDAIDYYGPAAEACGIALTFADRRRAPAEVQGDGDLLFEALGNLIDNATKFTPRGGRISVDLLDGPKIVVNDSGCGIPAAERESVKLRFQRGMRARDTAGNGLGLALVSAIARLHGMELSIESAQRGARVALTASNIGIAGSSAPARLNPPHVAHDGPVPDRGLWRGRKLARSLKIN